ncbi:MAG: cbb3-type cytochrome c oxidase subunit 3 [Saprospiraceae bacterium]|nr:cbb3-type cytochrome c oxidase subunit 3 [Saprospiraceae bacterium]
MKFGTYLTEIKGVSVYPIISLVLFVAFFALVIIWAYRSDSKDIEHFEKLPLEDGQISDSNNI